MEEDDYFGWADAPDADDIPTLDDDFTTFDDMAPPKTDESRIVTFARSRQSIRKRSTVVTTIGILRIGFRIL